MPEARDLLAETVLTKAINQILEEGSTAALATLITAQRGVGAKLLITEHGPRCGSLGDADLDDAVALHAAQFLSSRAETRTYTVNEVGTGAEWWSDARVLLERLEPEPRLIVCGAGHVGAALARLAHLLGYRVTLIDDRADFVKPARFPGQDIELVAADNWTNAVHQAIGNGRGVSVAVVTRGHNQDEECMRAVLKARPDYVGLIGSRRRTNIVLEHLWETGADEVILNQVRAPIGLDIGAVSPEEVALSILAEIVAERRRGTGAPLSAWRRG